MGIFGINPMRQGFFLQDATRIDTLMGGGDRKAHRFSKKEISMIHVFEDRAPTLEEAQEIVGGLVELVHSPEHQDWQILVNEEGLLNGLPFNDEATKICGTGIVGPAIVLKGEARGT